MVFSYDEGTDVYVDTPTLRVGAASEGLRILRSRADERALRLVVEGRGNRTYVVGVRSPHRLGTAAGVDVAVETGRNAQLRIRFDGPATDYVRREITIPLRRQ